jgi:RNA polymerase subunit RPABC4/transcription elongation factor Spt4
VRGPAARACPACGAPFPEGLATCPSCHAEAAVVFVTGPEASRREARRYRIAVLVASAAYVAAIALASALTW